MSHTPENTHPSTPHTHTQHTHTPTPIPIPTHTPLSLPSSLSGEEDWGDGRDHGSRFYRVLHTSGCTPERLDYYGVQLVTRPDERAGVAKPAQMPRPFWRYPVYDDDGYVLTWRLAAVDGERPRSLWEGMAHPEVIYEPGIIVPGLPLLILGDVLSCWSVVSQEIVGAVTFLCGPRSAVPVRALEQIVMGRPSHVLVIDNGTPTLPGGAPHLAALLRTAGLPATHAVLPHSPIFAPAEMTMTHFLSRFLYRDDAGTTGGRLRCDEARFAEEMARITVCPPLTQAPVVKEDAPTAEVA